MQDRLAQEVMVFNYSSTLRDSCTAEDISQILYNAFWNNRRNGLTGYLRLRGRQVFQTLEGDPEILSSVAAKIISDRRHTDVSVKRFSLSQVRLSKSWSVSGLEDAGLRVDAEGLSFLDVLPKAEERVIGLSERANQSNET